MSDALIVGQPPLPASGGIPTGEDPARPEADAHAYVTVDRARSIVKAAAANHLPASVIRTPAELAADSRRRWHQLRLNVLAGGSARLVAAVCSFVQVAILVRALGTDGYGHWIILLGVASFITLFDAGVGINLETALAEAWARRDDAELRRIVGSGLVTLAILGAAYVVIGLGLLHGFDAAARILLPDQSPELLTGATFVIVAFAIGVPLNLAPRLAGALQLGRLHAAWNAAGTVAALLFSFLATTLGGSWLTIVIGLSVLPLVQSAGLLLQLWRRLGWPATWPGTVARAAWLARLRRGLPLAGPLLGQSLVQAVPPIAIASVAGPAGATAFNLIQRLALPLAQGLGLLLTPLWPTYIEARARGDHAWLRQMLRVSLAAAVAGALVLALAIQGREPLLRTWVGDAVVVPSTAFAWAAGAWFAVNLIGQPLWHFLVGTGQWRALGLLSAAGQGGALAVFAVAAARSAPPAVQLTAATATLLLLWLPALIDGSRRALAAPPAP